MDIAKIKMGKPYLYKIFVEFLGKTLLLMMLVSIFVGLFLYMAPGRIDMTVPTHIREKIEQEDNRNLSGFVSFYFRWINQMVSMEIGRNIYGYKIKEVIGQKLRVTSILCFGSAFLSVSTGFLFGFIMSSRPDKSATKFGLGFIYLVTSIPSFFLSYMLIMIHPVVPGHFLSYLYAIFVLTVGDGLISELSRVVTGGIEKEYEMAYIETAITKGLKHDALFPFPGTVFFHTARQAFIRVLPRIGLKIPQIIGLSMIVEKIFSLEGLGGMMIDGLSTKDVNQVLIVTLCFAMLVRVMIFLNDTLLYALNPKANK